MAEREVVVLLGADLGDPIVQCDRAEQMVSERIAPVLARSRDHWTKPWGVKADTLFLNRALLLNTAMDAASILHTCLAIERELGRVRPADGSMVSRVIDIDILLVGNEVVAAPDLEVPHPRLALRRFALSPLCDVLPAWEHPVLHHTALHLLNAVPA